MNIDYALVEKVRPPIYTAMKYWGKKPHNIWQKYIKCYAKDGVMLDPFCGSAMSAVEALHIGQKAICFDLNPLSSFLIEIYSSPFDEAKYVKNVKELIFKIKNDEIYQKMWEYDGLIHNVKYNNEKLYEVCTAKIIKGKIKNGDILSPRLKDEEAIEFSKTLNLKALDLNYIDESFFIELNANFIENIGGNNFKNIWTKRNLYVLSLIFQNILKLNDETIKKQLLFAFIQSVHLCSKMCVPRTDKGNRPFSTSWGRSAYIIGKRQMEQNPLLVFEKSALGKQSAQSALKHSNVYLDKNIKLKQVSSANKLKNDTSFDLKYGTVNVLNLEEYLNEKSIDFIMTDPPYGGLVRYLDLSYIWNIWLKSYDKRFANIDFNGEITINKKVNLKNYETRFTTALKQIHKVLKDDGVMVITFHNKEIKIWNIFIKALKNANFVIEKVIHQKNARSGESVVANPYGTSGTDFYIRCKKDFNSNKKNHNESNLEEKIIKVAIEAIARRNEPTPYEILFDAILAEISTKGYVFSDDCDGDIKKSLNRELNKIFIIVDKNLWWFKNPSKHINFYEIPLRERVQIVLLKLLREKAFVSLDECLEQIYRHFINGLTPSQESVLKILNQLAVKSSGKWIYKNELEEDFSLHTKYIFFLIKIGQKLGYEVFVGKREQGEIYKGKKLLEYANLSKLDFIDNKLLRRIEMIDCVFVKDKKIEKIFEIENSTSIISAFDRASSLDKNISKFIIIPQNRENELLKILKNPLSNYAFNRYQWSYMLYDDIDKLVVSKKPDFNLFKKVLQ